MKAKSRTEAWREILLKFSPLASSGLTRTQICVTRGPRLSAPGLSHRPLKEDPSQPSTQK